MDVLANQLTASLQLFVQQRLLRSVSACEEPGEHVAPKVRKTASLHEHDVSIQAFSLSTWLVVSTITVIRLILNAHIKIRYFPPFSRSNKRINNWQRKRGISIKAEIQKWSCCNISGNFTKPEII